MVLNGFSSNKNTSVPDKQIITGTIINYNPELYQFSLLYSQKLYFRRDKTRKIPAGKNQPGKISVHYASTSQEGRITGS